MACGSRPTITEATLAGYDYAAFTGQAAADDGAPLPLRLLSGDQRLSARALADTMSGEGHKRVVLDVRPAAQFAIGHLAGVEQCCLSAGPYPSGFQHDCAVLSPVVAAVWYAF